MDSLYLLLPMSVLLVLALIGVFAWALNSGQYDDLEREGWRVLEGDANAQMPVKPGEAEGHRAALDPDQGSTRTPSRQ
jgi:cbb3-type cytochrome oxidase maturation protein